jgi:N-acetylglucosamine-6-phosphate deacetylase
MNRVRGIAALTGEPVEVTFNAAIAAVDPVLPPDPMPQTFLSPGWIDLQVNGFGGADYNSADTSLELIEQSLAAQFATGVTRLYPTLITGGQDEMMGAFRNLAKARRTLRNGKAMEAFHAEGPHISPIDGPRGAHPLNRVRKPDFDEFRQLQDAAEGNIRLLTIAPEWPEAPGFIERVVQEGVVVSIGHTAATGNQIADAVRAGATMSTHLGNGAHGEMRRHPNYLWDQMAEDRLTASFIVDGIHIGEAFLKVGLRAKGIERSVLVTDAVMPAGCAPGDYLLGEVAVTLHEDESVRLRGGTRLAGSSLQMHKAVGNVCRLAGVRLREAVTMASINAARVGRVPNRLRGIAPGERGDLVEFGWDAASCTVRVLRTWLSGELVFTAEGL